MLNVISHGGYYSTGGSIVRDTFKEFEPVFEFPSEFRLLKERNGLFDLEDALLQSYSPEIIDLAIKDFLWLTTNMARNSGRFTKLGMSYDKKTGNVFTKATNEFIEEISDYHYPMDWHFYEFKKNYLSQMATKIEKRFLTKDIRKREGRQLAFMAFPESQKYFNASRDYLNKIFTGFLEVNNLEKNSVVSLHNAIPPTSNKLINKGSKYFNSCKVVVVDRDPRDVFINYPKDSYGRYLPIGDNLFEKAAGFVHFYKSIRKNQADIKTNANVLFLNFEDCILNYEKFLEELYAFTDLSPSLHLHKSKIFNPKSSIKNIGMWKNASGDMAKAIKYIEIELSDYI